MEVGGPRVRLGLGDGRVSEPALIREEFERRACELLRLPPAGDIATAVLALTADVTLAPTEHKRRRLWWVQQLMANKARLDVTLPRDYRDDRHWPISEALPETESMGQRVGPLAIKGSTQTGPDEAASPPLPVVELRAIEENAHGRNDKSGGGIKSDENQCVGIALTDNPRLPVGAFCRSPDRHVAILAARDEARRRVLGAGSTGEVAAALQAGVVAVHRARV